MTIRQQATYLDLNSVMEEIVFLEKTNINLMVVLLLLCWCIKIGNHVVSFHFCRDLPHGPWNLLTRQIHHWQTLIRGLNVKYWALMYFWAPFLFWVGTSYTHLGQTSMMYSLFYLSFRKYIIIVLRCDSGLNASLNLKLSRYVTLFGNKLSRYVTLFGNKELPSDEKVD
jgi:hypothetical protein